MQHLASGYTPHSPLNDETDQHSLAYFAYLDTPTRPRRWPIAAPRELVYRPTPAPPPLASLPPLAPLPALTHLPALTPLPALTRLPALTPAPTLVSGAFGVSPAGLTEHDASQAAHEGDSFTSDSTCPSEPREFGLSPYIWDTRRAECAPPASAGPGSTGSCGQILDSDAQTRQYLLAAFVTPTFYPSASSWTTDPAAYHHVYDPIPAQYLAPRQTALCAWAYDAPESGPSRSAFEYDLTLSLEPSALPPDAFCPPAPVIEQVGFMPAPLDVPPWGYGVGRLELEERQYIFRACRDDREYWRHGAHAADAAYWDGDGFGDGGGSREGGHDDETGTRMGRGMGDGEADSEMDRGWAVPVGEGSGLIGLGIRLDAQDWVSTPRGQ